VKPNDPWQNSARLARESLGRPVQMITTDEVLTEFLAALSASAPNL